MAHPLRMPRRTTPEPARQALLCYAQDMSRAFIDAFHASYVPSSEAFGSDTALDAVEALDRQMSSLVKRMLGFKAALLLPRLLSKRPVLSDLGEKRDRLVHQGASSTSSQVRAVESKIRSVTASIVGDAVAEHIDSALSPLKVERDQLIRSLSTEQFDRYYT